MKLALVAYDWENAWIPMYEAAAKRNGDDLVLIHPSSEELIPADAYLHMWAVGNAHMNVSGKQQIVFMRRFEFFHNWTELPWVNINHLVFCNDYFRKKVEQEVSGYSYKPEMHTIYNAVNPRSWTYRQRGHGRKIGMACHIHPKKNLPMALQILAKLPEGFELHIAGGFQDGATLAYLKQMAELCKGRKVVLYGHISRHNLNMWWEDKNYCLSTSLSEGNPNNVIEAMAKGIKPVVHAWPGASDQFPDVFLTAEEAVSEITRGPYESDKYLKIVKTRHSMDNIQRVMNLIERRDPMASEKTLVKNGLSEQNSCDHDPKAYGQDTMSDKKGQKPMATPKTSVSEKGKNFTIR